MKQQNNKNFGCVFEQQSQWGGSAACIRRGIIDFAWRVWVWPRTTGRHTAQAVRCCA